MNLLGDLKNAKCTQIPEQLVAVLTRSSEMVGPALTISYSDTDDRKPRQVMDIETDCMCAPPRAGSLNSGLD